MCSGVLRVVIYAFVALETMEEWRKTTRFDSTFLLRRIESTQSSASVHLLLHSLLSFHYHPIN